jgi:WD40 repeat protein
VVFCVKFIQNGKKILIGHEQGVISIRDTNGMNLIYSKRFIGSCLSIAVNNNNVFLASCGDSIYLLNNRLKVIKYFKHSEDNVQTLALNDVQALAFNYDNVNFVSGGNDRNLIFFDIERGKIQTLKRFQSPITSLEYTSDGNHILVSSGEKYAESWFTPSFYLKEKIYHYSKKELYDLGVQLELKDFKVFSEKAKLSGRK